jgi:hypothetical protein
VGSLVASILVSNERLAAWFGIGVAMWGAPLIALAAFPGVGAALVLFALLGVGNALVDVGVFTLIGRLAPERVLARVFGLVECVGALAVGAGSVLAAGVAGGTSLRVALAALGAVGPVLVLLSWRGLRRLDAVMVVRGEDMALLRTVRALDPLPLPALEQLATALEPRHVPAGGQLFAQGDAGDGCFVIESGVAEVIGDGHRIVTLGPSELVGEIALLRHVPRTATVRAVTDLDVRRLDGERFVDVVTGWERSRVAAGHQVDQLLDRYSPEPPSVE